MNVREIRTKYIWAMDALFALGMVAAVLREIPELGMQGLPLAIAMILAYVGAGFYLAKSGLLGGGEE